MAAASQAILHATVAALVTEALLWLWRVDQPGERLAMRWIAIGAPLLLTTAYLVLLPWRASPWFVERWSLFAGAHWNQIRVGGYGLASAAGALLAVIGTALYLRDAVPFIADRLVRASSEGALPEQHQASARVRELIAALGAGGFAQPSVTVVDAASPVLLCTGIDQTTIVLSTGTLDRLDDEALTAALAHEMAHLAARDPLTGWWLMAARTLQFFNPAVQIVARQAVQELERRADAAVAAQGRAAQLASAIQRLSLAADVHSDLALPPGSHHAGDRVLASAHRRALDTRCQLLIEGVIPAGQPHRAWRVGLAGAALAGLLFLVV